MLRRLLFSAAACAAAAQPATAADLPYNEAPPAYVAPIFSWTGLYLGGQIGYAWGNDNFSGYGPGYSFSGVNATPSGVVGGGHVGYNYQLNQFVIGLEGDVEGLSYGKAYQFGNTTYNSHIPVQGSIRGRLGFELDRALFYVTGGGSFADFNTTYQTPFGFNSFSRSVAGWTIGGGIEYAITNNWTARAEYRYADYGSFTDYPYSAPGTSSTHHETTNAVRLGFSYKFDSFGPMPIGAR